MIFTTERLHENLYFRKVFLTAAKDTNLIIEVIHRLGLLTNKIALIKVKG